MADADLASGNDYVDAVRKQAEEEGSRVVVVSAQVESELVELEEDDKREFLESLGGWRSPGGSSVPACTMTAASICVLFALASLYRVCTREVRELW